MPFCAAYIRIYAWPFTEAAKAKREKKKKAEEDKAWVPWCSMHGLAERTDKTHRQPPNIWENISWVNRQT
jgi:hypothetical protein